MTTRPTPPATAAVPTPAHPGALGALTALVTLAALAAAPLTANAQQDYPNRAVRIVVPFPAASGTDIVARVISEKLQPRLGQPVIIDNRPGAGGNLGSAQVASAPKDGYTLLAGTAANAVSASLYTKLGYDFLKDFAPITRTIAGPLVIMANPQLPFNNVRDLVAWAKANPGKARFGSGGNGSINHLAGELLNYATGAGLVHVPYKAGSAATTDVIGGQIELAIDSVLAGAPHIKSGRVKGIAVTSATRSDSLPDVPTVAEQGVARFDVSSWHGLLAPAGTPTAIVERLNREVVTVLAMPEVKDKLSSAGAMPAGQTTAEFAEFLRNEVAKWGEAVRRSGAKAD